MFAVRSEPARMWCSVFQSELAQIDLSPLGIQPYNSYGSTVTPVELLPLLMLHLSYFGV